MRTSPTLPCDAVIPELDAPRIRPTSDPPPGRVGAPAEVTLRLVQDHHRVAAGMNHIVVHWLFSAGLSLEQRWGRWATIARPQLFPPRDRYTKRKEAGESWRGRRVPRALGSGVRQPPIGSALHSRQLHEQVIAGA